MKEEELFKMDIWKRAKKARVHVLQELSCLYLYVFLTTVINLPPPNIGIPTHRYTYVGLKMTEGLVVWPGWYLR